MTTRPFVPILRVTQVGRIPDPRRTSPLGRNSGRNLVLAMICAVALVNAADAQNSSKSQSQSGVDLTAIDKSVSPCADFYQYACGSWMKNNPIPADESSWNRFNELHERNQTVLRNILEDSEHNQSRSHIDQKIGGFYGSCMDETAIEQRGTAPLKPELERISSIHTGQELLDEVERLHERQISVFFEFASMPDPKNAHMTIAGLDQGGIGLPERDFYFRTDAKSEEIRRKYVAHVARMFELAGIPRDAAAKKAATVMSIETELAKASLDVTARRDPKLLVHEMPLTDLAKMTPSFSFDEFFTGVHTPAFQKLNVAVPDFFKALNAVLTAHSMDDLQSYLTWHYLSGSATLLTKAFVDENFDFYGKTLSGTKELKPRWKRCVSATDDSLGDALGRKFVEKTFGEEGKQHTLQMVHEIEHQMGNDIQSITWMGPDTKKEAMIKLHAVADKIGFPDKWKDYSTVNIVDNDYFGNRYRADEYESKRQRDKIGKPVDRTEWDMTAPTVNAYYDPTQNNINFPAGILQPPFYSKQAGDAVNYGGIGMVIGHELTHGFDDEGRQFDADGNLKDWWQKTDEEKFQKKADCIDHEYGGFNAAPGLKLNGKLTLGENTADNGGIRLAYFALMDDLEKRSIPVTTKVDGYTEAQQFFLGFAQVWCQNIRPEMARLYAQTDPHSPPEFRVDGVVSNMTDFDKAFSCKPGDKMYKAQTCRVW
ncbi:MAG: M13 family metallopeptidase [Acidobacteriota bacterium]|nr:M13 family metallopeptidase [Acidobacteriota bacterium]